MTPKLLRTATFLLALTTLPALFVSAVAPPRGALIEGPVGFHLAKAELNRAGQGLVLWKAAEGYGAVVDQYEQFEVIRRHELPGYLAKGFLRSADHLLLQGLEPEGASDRLLEVSGDNLRQEWSTAQLLESGIDRDEVVVSRDLGWWYAPEYLPASVLIRAGRIGEEESLRWTVEVDSPEAFMAGLGDVTLEDGMLTLAYSTQGRGWLLPPSQAPRSLVRPPGCDEIYTVDGAADGFWAHCGGGLVALYPAVPSGSGAVEPLAFDAVTDLRFLPNGHAVGVVRRHGGPGSLARLTVGEGRIQRGPETPLPVTLGQIGTLAGEVALIEIEHGSATTAPRYRILPLPPQVTAPSETASGP